MEGAIVQRDGADMNTEPVPAAKTPWLSSLGQLSTVTAALSVLIVCLAFIHEWAYFRVVGMQFQALMSPSDYITSVIGWLPLLALGMTVPWLNEMFTRRLEGFRPLAEIRATYKTPRRAWWAYDAPYVMMGWILIVLGVVAGLFLPWSFSAPVLLLSASIAWFWAIAWYISHKHVAARMTPAKSLVLFFAPPIAAMAFGVGHSSAQMDLQSTDARYVIRSNRIMLKRTFEC